MRSVCVALAVLVSGCSVARGQWWNSSSWTEQRIGQHIAAGSGFRNAETTVSEIVERLPDPRPWPGAGLVHYENSVARISVSVLDVLNLLVEWEAESDAISDLLPYLNVDVGILDLPARSRSVVFRAVSRCVSEYRFAVAKRGEDTAVGAFAVVSYSGVKSSGIVFVFDNGLVFHQNELGLIHGPRVLLCAASPRPALEIELPAEKVVVAPLQDVPAIAVPPALRIGPI
jgi:hypothetical protein